ncbi:rCG20348 [Rattus norvegicus]|uniref:RCG20348 n=1 Tax=Rattus norvegicus TaxID=10116 RepID=A6JG56_RAT|nr:rCG20348 [Rattus norvegicus]
MARESAAGFRKPSTAREWRCSISLQDYPGREGKEFVTRETALFNTNLFLFGPT